MTKIKNRTCFICEETYPQTRFYFYDSTKYMHEGGTRRWSSYCIKCCAMYGIISYRKKRLLRGFEGYLMEPIKNIEHVRRYLNEPRLPCLLCGKRYDLLSTHISKVHKLTPREYKRIFNIPLSYSLTGRDYKQRKKKQASLYNKERKEILEKALPQARNASKGKSRKITDLPDSTREIFKKNYKKRISKGKIARKKSDSVKVEVHCSGCGEPIFRTSRGLKSMETQGLKPTCRNCAFQKNYEKNSSLNIAPKTIHRGLVFELDIIKFLDAKRKNDKTQPSKLVSEIIRASDLYKKFYNKSF